LVIGQMTMESEDAAPLATDLLQVKKLFANNHLSDVLFVFSDAGGDGATDDREGYKSSSDHLIPAHRLVLALRSGAFQTALLRAKSSQVPGQVRFPLKIHVQDTPYRVFYAMLRFLYTGDLGTDGEGGDGNEGNHAGGVRVFGSVSGGHQRHADPSISALG